MNLENATQQAREVYGGGEPVANSQARVEQPTVEPPAQPSGPVPSIGRIVHYRLNEDDAIRINRRREHAMLHMDEHRANANGVQVHVGNAVKPGDTVAMVIVAAWGTTPDAAVNGQALLDGCDAFWVTSRSRGEGPGTWSWPPRV